MNEAVSKLNDNIDTCKCDSLIAKTGEIAKPMEKDDNSSLKHGARHFFGITSDIEDCRIQHLQKL